MILMDAGPMVALLDANDQHHGRCVKALRRIGEPLVTVWPAVTEAISLLGFSLDAQAALLGRLEDEAPRLLPLDRRDVPRIRELMHKYRDRKMDLADAALVRVAERERISTVFTIDRTDFQVYRSLGSRRFTVIP
jgi:hypothetical protein